ncbi:MFS transporter [Nakamurella multipartita]|uniref:Multidrug efflux pump Tap n=1 Tax=Nakamurella multipartita (strain ATCC 700099 / DSM 44233 / CIP 104796 / JCM 9543 / NBRC 105858 / Y-104) TaxID=479431 RepID=C8XF73_NAKMY|nr:MFS transporter [Nakamurella multipartita]ACV77959.1 major facilitator superfamily MFS_1 [Nakamurella multipartita DSM 44233]
MRTRSVTGLIGVLAATALSVTANSVVAIAVPWLVLERTGSAALAGLAGAAAIAPIVFSAVFGGALIDRIGKRRTCLIADTLSAAAVAALPLADATVGLTTGLVLVLVAVGAVFDSPGAAAREALRPDVARAAQVPLARVNAWGEVAENTGYLAGPALAGLLLVVVGGFGTVWVAAALFGLSLLVTWFLVPAHLSVRPSPEPYLRSVWDGIRLLLRDSTLRAVTLTAAVIWLFLLPFESVVLNAYLNESGQVVAFGVILAAYAGGAIGGALAYGAIAHRVPTRVALIVALALAGLSLGAFAVLPPVPVMVALALAAGVVTGPINPLCALIVQSRTPARFRGRVIGSYTALALAAGPLGLLAFGPLVDTYGPAAGFAAIGGGLLLAALLAAGAPGLRRLAGSA